MKRWQQFLAVGGGIAGVAGAAIAAAMLRDRIAETPKYQVIVSDGVFEVRKYPALIVAETASPIERTAALEQGMRKLSAYLAGKDRANEADTAKIALTAPTLADRHDGRWRTRLIMPARYVAEGLPLPGVDVMIAKIAERRVGVIEFVGRATDATLEETERALRAWLVSRGERPDGPGEYAFYNSPAVPPLLRRTEVIVPLAR